MKFTRSVLAILSVVLAGFLWLLAEADAASQDVPFGNICLQAVEIFPDSIAVMWTPAPCGDASIWYSQHQRATLNVKRCQGIYRVPGVPAPVIDTLLVRCPPVPARAT